MSKRVAFICRGKSENFTNKQWDGLSSLDNNVEKIVDYLRRYGKWEIDEENIFTVEDSDTISKKISTLDNNEDTEVLLYYTGHGGVSGRDSKYCLVGRATCKSPKKVHNLSFNEV